jgi:hypothetical protein
VLVEINALLKRPPSATQSDAGAAVHTWTYATANHASRVEFRTASGSAPGRLSAAVLVKP